VLHEPTSPTLAPPASTPDLTSTPSSPDTSTAVAGPRAEPRADPRVEGSSVDASGGRERPTPPGDLRPLALRARHDTVAARELAASLLGRGWDARRTAAVAGLAESTVAALAHVRRPGTAARAVADDVVARARRRAAGLLPALRRASQP